MPDSPPDPHQVLEHLARMPWGQLVPLGLFALTWIVGGNLVVAAHYRRMGRSPWSIFHPFQFPFRNFNAREWLSLLGVAVLAFSFVVLAMYFEPRGTR